MDKDSDDGPAAESVQVVVDETEAKPAEEEEIDLTDDAHDQILQEAFGAMDFLPVSQPEKMWASTRISNAVLKVATITTETGLERVENDFKDQVALLSEFLASMKGGCADLVKAVKDHKKETDQKADKDRKRIDDAEKAQLAQMSAIERKAHMLVKSQSKFLFSGGSAIVIHTDTQLKEQLKDLGTAVSEKKLLDSLAHLQKPWLSDVLKEAKEVVEDECDFKTTFNDFIKPEQAWASRQMKEKGVVTASISEKMGKSDLAKVWAYAMPPPGAFVSPDAAKVKTIHDWWSKHQFEAHAADDVMVDFESEFAASIRVQLFGSSKVLLASAANLHAYLQKNGDGGGGGKSSRKGRGKASGKGMVITIDKMVNLLAEGSDKDMEKLKIGGVDLYHGVWPEHTILYTPPGYVLAVMANNVKTVCVKRSGIIADPNESLKKIREVLEAGTAKNRLSRLLDAASLA